MDLQYYVEMVTGRNGGTSHRLGVKRLLMSLKQSELTPGRD